MASEPTLLLGQIVARYGTSVIEEPSRFAALLNDMRKGGHKRDVSLLITALHEGIPQRLLLASPEHVTRALVAELAARLSGDAGLASDAALWAVEAWAEGLTIAIAEPVRNHDADARQPDFPVPTPRTHRPSPAAVAAAALVVLGGIGFFASRPTDRPAEPYGQPMSSGSMGASSGTGIISSAGAWSYSQSAESGPTEATGSDEAGDDASGAPTDPSPPDGATDASGASPTAVEVPAKAPALPSELARGDDRASANGIGGPGSRLSEADLAGHTPWELDVTRNGYFARHGYRFKRQDLRDYFSGLTWYQPDTDDPAVVWRRLSRTEQQNANLILVYQRKLRQR